MLEGLYPAGQFIPASESDFDRYSKDLGWLLVVALSEAKERLAQLYGFSSYHEIRETLNQKLPPGPFNAEPVIPAFFFTRHASSGPDHVQPEDPLFIARTRRVWDILPDDLADRWGPRNIAVVEAGFFCSPKVHRSLFARVKSGIEAVESKDTQKAYEFFSRHWPVGYWTLLDLWYRKIPDLDETGLKNLKSFTLDWTPSQALRSLWAFKAAAIYARITDLGGGDWPKEEYPPLARETSDQAGLYDFDPPRSKRGFGKFRQSLSDNDIDSVRTSVDRDDGELMHNADLLSRGHTEQDLRALSASIRSERFSQLRAYTNPRGVCPAAEVRELIHIRNPWPLSKSGRAYAKYVSTHPNEPIPVEVVRDRYEGTNKYLSCYVALNTEDDASEDDSVQVINFDASFFYDPPPGENGEPKRRSVVGAAIGYVLVPFGHDGPTDAQSWFDGLDISGQQMADVWKALRADYFPSKGIEDIEDFVALNPGRSVVIVDKIELLPKYRGKGIAPYLFELLSSAFDSRADGYDGCHIDGVVDSLWYVCASDLAFRREIAHIDGEIKPPREYVIPIGKPAVFVVAVNGERASALHPPMTQLLDSLARFRKNPSSPEEVIKRKLTAHFAQMARGRDYDIICYDPEEWPDT